MVLDTRHSALRIAIVVDDVSVPAWKKKVIDGLIEMSQSPVIELFLHPSAPKGGRQLRHLHIALDRWYFKPSPDAFNACKLDDGQRNGTIAELQRAQQDLLIWLSEENLPKELQRQSAFVVLALVHGENHSFAGQDLGYADFYHRREVISSTLVGWRNGKTWLVEQTWSMMKTMSISRSRNEHFWKLSTILLRAIRKFSRMPKEKYEHAFIELPQFSSAPNPTLKGIGVFKNLYAHALRFGMKAWRKLQYKEQWILLLKMQKGIAQDFEQFKKILPPKDCFWADPFVVENEGKRYLFFEELPYATDKGHLCVTEIDDHGNISTPVKILDLPYHLSYPFIFEQDGHFYMIPESYQARNIQLFEATQFPYQWEHKMDLMTEVAAFDTTLFFYNNKWWMFTVLAEKGSGHNDELFLFYADSPFTDQWASHPQNPIVSDVRTARPAGNIYEEGGKIIRPSQDCSRKYGFGFNLNEIVVLSETDYQEKRMLHVRPWEKGLTRTHSFNHSESVTVIDAAIQRSRFF